MRSFQPQVDPSECTYIIDSSIPSQKPTELQPDYASDSELFCEPILDAAATPWWARIFYLPGSKVENARVWGEYCLLRNRDL
jgi:alpha-1,2-mannosyltransferase